MFRIPILFLLCVLIATTAYRFRCYAFCEDQTGVQNDYVYYRDKCREYAQIKLDTGYRDPAGGDVTGKKALLVSLFSECMAKNGWTIPDGKPTGTSSAPPATTAPAPPVAANPEQKKVEDAVDKQRERAALARRSECAFARQAAKNSSIAAARAKACDMECKQRLRAAPDAPHPAACPSDVNPLLSTGVDRE